MQCTDQQKITEKVENRPFLTTYRPEEKSKING